MSKADFRLSKGRELITDEQFVWLKKCLMIFDCDKIDCWIDSKGFFHLDSDNVYYDRFIYIFPDFSRKKIENIPIKFADCKRFYIKNAFNVRSLENSPNEVTESFHIIDCGEMKSLKGISSKIDSLRIEDCDSLVSLEGLKKINKCFIDPKTMKRIDPLQRAIVESGNLFAAWQKTGMELTEYIRIYSGFIDGKTYGI